MNRTRGNHLHILHLWNKNNLYIMYLHNNGVVQNLLKMWRSPNNASWQHLAKNYKEHRHFKINIRMFLLLYYYSEEKIIRDNDTFLCSYVRYISVFLKIQTPISVHFLPRPLFERWTKSVTFWSVQNYYRNEICVIDNTICVPPFNNRKHLTWLISWKQIQ